MRFRVLKPQKIIELIKSLELKRDKLQDQVNELHTAINSISTHIHTLKKRIIRIFTNTYPINTPKPPPHTLTLHNSHAQLLETTNKFPQEAFLLSNFLLSIYHQKKYKNKNTSRLEK